jgi:hypothetical protein
MHHRHSSCRATPSEPGAAKREVAADFLDNEKEVSAFTML